MANLPTIAMSPAPDRGYDPIADILAGRKTHTLRKKAIPPGPREVTVKRERTGIILNFVRTDWLTRAEYLTDEFAQADGLPDADALKKLLMRFYGQPPDVMACNHFRLEENSNAKTG